jgi:hypothetical protein
MSKWIKNNSGGDKTWLGQLLTDQQYYHIQTHEEISWANNSTLLSDIGNGDAVVAKDDSTNKDITDVNDAINYLKGLNNSIKILEEDINNQTGGHYQAQGYEIDVASGDSTKAIDIIFPVPIGLLSAEFAGKSGYAGDTIELILAPDNIVGAITQNVAATDTVLNVGQTVIDNTAVGYYIQLADGTNTDDCGRILSIDKVSNQITVETATTNAFLAATPTYVKMSIKMCPKMYLNDSGVISMGESKIGSTYIPANTTIRATYVNTNATAKKFHFVMEYLY